MLDLPLASSDGRESRLLHAIWKRNLWHLASYFPSEMEFQSHMCWTSQAGESLYSQLVLQAGGLCSLPSPESTHPLAAPRARGPLLREDTGFFFVCSHCWFGHKCSCNITVPEMRTITGFFCPYHQCSAKRNVQNVLTTEVFRSPCHFINCVMWM